MLLKCLEFVWFHAETSSVHSVEKMKAKIYCLLVCLCVKLRNTFLILGILPATDRITVAYSDYSLSGFDVMQFER